MKASAVLAAYRRYAKVYDVVFGKVFEAGRRQVVGDINRMSGPRRVLEVGVGTGLSLPHYRTDHRVVGIDLSGDMLSVARRRVAARRLSQVETLAEMDVEALTFAADSFDVVVAMYVMSVVPDPARAMGEIVRVCRPGGTVLLLNHFSRKESGRGNPIEACLSRFSETLGWRPYFPLTPLLARADGMEIGPVRPVPPLGLFAIVEARKTLAANGSVRTPAVAVVSHRSMTGTDRHGARP